MVTKRKATIPATPFVETVAPESEAPGFKFDFKALLIGEASWKRAACACVASLISSAAIGYFGGYLLGYLTLGAALLTGSAFITMLIYVLGLLVVMYAGYRASVFTYMKVIDKTVDSQFSAIKCWASNLFNSKEVTA